MKRLIALAGLLCLAGLPSHAQSPGGATLGMATGSGNIKMLQVLTKPGGTFLSLAKVNTALGSMGLAIPQSGGSTAYALNYEDGGANVSRAGDRLLVGGATVNDGTGAQTTKDWLEALIPNTTNSAATASLSRIGGFGLVGGSRSSDGGSTVGFASGVAAFAVADDTVGAILKTTTAFYSETRRNPGVPFTGSSHPALVVGAEFDTHHICDTDTNGGLTPNCGRSPVGTADPYSPYQNVGTINLDLAAGKPGLTTVANTIGIAFLRNGTIDANPNHASGFLHGIVFGATALEGNYNANAGLWGAFAYVPGQTVQNGQNIYRVRTGGTDVAGPGPTGYGTGIVSGGVTWDYVAGGDGTFGIGSAIEMATSQEIEWYVAGQAQNAAPQAAIRSDMKNLPASTPAELINFTDGAGITLGSSVAGAFSLGVIADPLNVNSVRINGSHSGSPVSVTAVGAASNINMYLASKGSSQIYFLNTAGNQTFAVDSSGHIREANIQPTLTNCGTSPSVGGSDGSGLIFTGTGATACTLTFALVYAQPPHCTVTAQSGASFSYTAYADRLVLNTAAATANYNYDCHAQTGG